MNKQSYRIYFHILLVAFCQSALAINSPSGFIVKQEGQSVEIRWNRVSDAEGYRLYYAPYPGGSPINSVDLGLSRIFSIEIETCEAFYVAVTAYKTVTETDENGVESSSEEESSYSSIKVVKEVNPSFFPIYSCAGTFSSNSWQYEMNHGHVLAQNSTITPADIVFNPAHISVNVANVQLDENFSANYVNNGVDIGEYSEYKSNDLILSGSIGLGTKTTEVYFKQLIDNAQFNLNDTVEILSTIENSPVQPTHWPPSREDLHLIPVGTIIASSIHPNTQLTMSVELRQPIVDIRNFGESIDFESRWIVAGKMESARVGGVNYFNIVVLVNEINGGFISLTGEVETQNRTITYLLSRGVGMISGEGQFNINETSLSIDLTGYSVQ